MSDHNTRYSNLFASRPFSTQKKSFNCPTICCLVITMIYFQCPMCTVVFWVITLQCSLGKAYQHFSATDSPFGTKGGNDTFHWNVGTNVPDDITTRTRNQENHIMNFQPTKKRKTVNPVDRSRLPHLSYTKRPS
jgi:hypothetical protein